MVDVDDNVYDGYDDRFRHLEDSFPEDDGDYDPDTGPLRPKLQVGMNGGGLLCKPKATNRGSPIVTYQGAEVQYIPDSSFPDSDDGPEPDWDDYIEPEEQEADANLDVASDLQDDLMADQIGRCKRPSQPPGMKK